MLVRWYHYLPDTSQTFLKVLYSICLSLTWYGILTLLELYASNIEYIVIIL